MLNNCMPAKTFLFLHFTTEEKLLRITYDALDSYFILLDEIMSTDAGEKSNFSHFIDRIDQYFRNYEVEQSLCSFCHHATIYLTLSNLTDTWTIRSTCIMKTH